MRSLTRRTQARLAFVFSLLFLAVGGAAIAAFWTSDSAYEYATIDQSLRGQADVVRAIVAQAKDVAAIPTLPPGNPRGVGIDSYVIDGHGRVLARDQPVLQSAAIIAYALSAGLPPRTQVASVRINGTMLRILSRAIVLPDGSAGGVVVARSIQELQDRLSRTAFLLVGGLIAAEIVVGLLAWRLSGLALVPVREISAAARDIGEHDLRQRIHTDIPSDDALGELVATFNGMLGRLEAFLDTQQRFTADAAHELRAPLAVLRSQVEVTLRQPRSREEYEQSNHALLVEIERLGRITDQLLLLARVDAGELKLRVRPCDITDLVEETVSRWRSVAAAKSVKLEASSPGSGVIYADPDLLSRMLDNLVDNAIQHTPAGGQVRVGAEHRDRTWTLSVGDTGPGIPTDARARVFERFFRADSARERGDHGAGLGLSICRAIARLHGGEIKLADSESGAGAELVVTLPGS